MIVLRALIDQTVRLRSLIESAATFSEVRSSIFLVYTEHSSQDFAFRTSPFLTEGSAQTQRLVSAL